MSAQAQAQTLSERADACLAALDEAGQAIARRVFLRLVSFDGGRAAVRRPQPLSALATSGEPERVAEILRHLTEARLLGIQGGEAPEGARVELADEALIASWPTLQAWIGTHGQTEQLRRQLEAEAAGWKQRADQGRGDVGLLDTGQLTELAAWLTTDTRGDLGVSAVAESFIAASRAAARRRWWPSRSYTGSALAILLMLMILATPIILLFIVVLTASVIHRFGWFT
ncbi:MAG TPA: hypothetical protein VF469_14185 [Kofleriaceae bacterium]